MLLALCCAYSVLWSMLQIYSGGRMAPGLAHSVTERVTGRTSCPYAFSIASALTPTLALTVTHCCCACTCLHMTRHDILLASTIESFSRWCRSLLYSKNDAGTRRWRVLCLALECRQGGSKHRDSNPEPPHFGIRQNESRPVHYPAQHYPALN